MLLRLAFMLTAQNAVKFDAIASPLPSPCFAVRRSAGFSYRETDENNFRAHATKHCQLHTLVIFKELSVKATLFLCLMIIASRIRCNAHRF